MRQGARARIAQMAAGRASIAGNLERARERIARAAERAGRRSEDVTLVAISKTFPAEAIREAFDAGARHFGENRVQEWEGKRGELQDIRAVWHLIGHLQSNKTKRAAGLFHAIDSVDSLELARRLDAAFASEPVNSSTAKNSDHSRRLNVLVEVRLSPEESKAGVQEAELPGLTEALLAMPHLELRGLMTIPPFLDDPEQVRPFFQRLRELRDSVSSRIGRSLPELSMGMSHDYEIAVEEGATQVRLGTAIFGDRTKIV
ncbi:MAG: YggS family pyridoxal phosphate-dependent enzyme [Candidatus Acidiferrales bacterium]